MQNVTSEKNLEAAPGMAKLLRESVPIRLLRNPSQLASVKEDLIRLRKAFSSSDAKGIFSKVRTYLARRVDGTALDQKIKQLEEREKKLEESYIDGMLTPLTEAEVWEVRVEFGAIYNMLLKRSQELEGQAKEAFLEELKDSSTALWVQKWISLALKRSEKVDGKWVRMGKVDDIDPPALSFAFNLYHQSFTLSGDELKKSVAPTTSTN